MGKGKVEGKGHTGTSFSPLRALNIILAMEWNGMEWMHHFIEDIFGSCAFRMLCHVRVYGCCRWRNW